MEPVKISHNVLAKAGATTVKLASGEVVFKDGDAPDNMYVVLSGDVEIRLRDTVIETVSQGGTFGEMAAPRSAAIVAPALRSPCAEQCLRPA
jgi:CRP-like cAMP-binding protein